MPRLIHLADYQYLRKGSFVPALLAILSDVIARGWGAEAVFVAGSAESPAWVGDLVQAGVGVHFAPRGSRKERSRWIGELLGNDGEPTVLHTHFTSFDIPSLLAARRHPGVKVVWHEHSALSDSPEIVARNVVKFGVLGHGVEKIICPAPDLAAAVRRRFGSRDRVVFLPNAIDSDCFRRAGASEREEARRGLGLPAEAPVLLGFAWHWDLKGGDLFVAALKRVRERFPEAIGVIVSEDPRAIRLQDDPALVERLRVLPPQEDVRRLYAAADVFVAPSRAEGGTPYAVLEAMAAGLPVVASRIPGHTFICDGLAACPTIAPEPGEIATAIGELLAAPPSDVELEEARRRIVSDFDLSTWCGRLVDLYLGALA